MRRHKNNVKKQGNKVPQTNPDVPTIESIDNTVEEMSEEFRKYIVRLIFKIKDGIGEKIQEVKDHVNREAGIIIRNQTEILQMKEIKKKIKNSMESVNNRLEHM